MSDITYSAELPITPLTKPPRATVTVPGSKSITNRALVLAALCSRFGGCVLTGALHSEDTEVMIDSLRKLGFRVDADWARLVVTVHRNESDRIIPAESADLFVANSGTSMRFLTAMVSLGHGRYRLDGIPRMRERPIRDLLDALRQLEIEAVSEANNGCPPVAVASRGWPRVVTQMLSHSSETISQFLSCLLMAAAFAPIDTWIKSADELVSEPYVDMTVRMLNDWHRSIISYTTGEFEVQQDTLH